MRTLLAVLAGLLLFVPAAHAADEAGGRHLTVVRCNVDGSYDCAMTDCTGTNWCCV